MAGRQSSEEMLQLRGGSSAITGNLQRDRPIELRLVEIGSETKGAVEISDRFSRPSLLDSDDSEAVQRVGIARCYLQRRPARTLGLGSAAGEPQNIAEVVPGAGVARIELDRLSEFRLARLRIAAFDPRDSEYVVRIRAARIEFDRLRGNLDRLRLPPTLLQRGGEVVPGVRIGGRKPAPPPAKNRPPATPPPPPLIPPLPPPTPPH